MADTMAVESWDDEFEGNFHALASHSTATSHTNFSSRMSVASESGPGADDDWNLVIQPDNEQSTHQAVASAKAAGIPLPANVPQSALLGGTIRRLGKQKSKQRVADDWDEDIEMPDGGALQLRQPRPIPITPAAGEEHDDFDDLEGSLGIRFAGTKRGVRARSSSASAMSPSLGSITAESEDELQGLELPEGPMDFDAMLKKRRAGDAELSDLSQPSPALEQPATMNVHKKSRLLETDNDDYLLDFEGFEAGGILDPRRGNLNKNLKVKNPKPAGPLHRPATNLNFHDKPVDRPVHSTIRSHIPRPVSGSKPAASRLEPVFEAGASRANRERRQPTTTGAQLLKSKRSLPALRSQPPATTAGRPPVPFLPAGVTNNQPQHAALKRMPYHLRRDSDPHRAQSPPLRSHSRLSTAYVPETPSRASKQRPNVAPTALAREAAAKRTITKPARRMDYGNGNELEIFDDLPTSVAKENKFVKQPVARGPPKLSIRHTQSRSDIRDTARRNIPDRMTTPAPRTPMSPTRGLQDLPNQTPSYMRDTASSRITRETRLNPNNTTNAAPTTHNNTRPRSDGPLPLTQLSNNFNTNFRPQGAPGRSTPHSSPSAQRTRQRTKQPQLIKGIGAHVPKTEKGMVYNPHTLRWEGNENTVAHFDLPGDNVVQTPTPTGTSDRHRDYIGPPSYDLPAPSASPPRPALIAPMSNAAMTGVQVNGGMVFDPRQMKWLKLKDHPRHQQQSHRGHNSGGSGPLSPSVTSNGEDDKDDEEDAFAGIPDLVDHHAHPSIPGAAAAASAGLASPVSLAAQPGNSTATAGAASGVGEVHEEFDLGPKFIEMQTAEEGIWRKRCAAWFAAASPSAVGAQADGGEEDVVARADDGRWRWGIRAIASYESEAEGLVGGVEGL